MASNAPIKRKHYELDSKKIKRAQKLLRTKTETEAIEHALDAVIAGREAQRRAWASTERFIKSGAVIDDVFGRLDDARE